MSSGHLPAYRRPAGAYEVKAASAEHRIPHPTPPLPKAHLPSALPRKGKP
jgi:hypothetical protein